MKIDGTAFRSLWLDETDQWSLRIIDQTKLPWALEMPRLASLDEVAHAISAMLVRGAPLIGATAAYGVAIAMRADSSDAALQHAITTLAATRPTAINLRWALVRMQGVLQDHPKAERAEIAYAEAAAICDEDVATNRAIGEHGLGLIRARAVAGRRVNILTHCNAGWIATVDWGTALAPIYRAYDEGIDVHVFVDETRPRNQGASLTAWELGKHGVRHTVIVDNAGGHLMQRGEIDMVIVGTDRVTRTGDVCNKIGTYLKALAARDNGIPFYVALPSSTIDWSIADGLAEIPIEERAATEVTTMTGRALDGTIATIRIVPKDSAAANPAFDVTPARLVSGLITERGVCAADAASLAAMFPECRKQEAA
ncbi:S-methyl-5-thioribose-1-phosphate isomerase [Acidiphilium sp.]|uniref:S-methyl-5-thioribose-1-phosphate isomerase n=1 Tax=Acidiphilium sp. TaxID=527 RepID=UPI003D080CEF